MRTPLPIFASLVLACASVAPLAQNQSVAPGNPETRAERAYRQAVSEGSPALRTFLASFPKGADLHVHLSGAVYAESFLRDAGADGLCLNPATLSFNQGACPAPAKPDCAAALIPASQFPRVTCAADQDVYDRLIDFLSMRSFVPSSGISGHDQFFATFARFPSLTQNHTGEWVDEVGSRAAAQNQQYLELMETPPHSNADAISATMAWNPDMASLRDNLIKAGLFNEVDAGRADARDAEAQRKQIEHCDTPAQAAPACQVEIRYIYQIARANPPVRVFARTLLGFETIEKTIEAHEPGFVGINFVQPEDGYISMHDYTLQMEMLEYLHGIYPNVHITLHAGELVLGLVPPEGLRFHIRQAVELGHAERIGHGVDISYEDNASQLLKEMADKHIMIEINLSSNEGILGVKGAAHPFPLYMKAHVPVALSTDDEGVSRIDLTNEYVRAAIDYHLTYADLKRLARTGLEHNFLAGASLWARQDDFTTAAAACKGQTLGGDKPTSGCAAFLDANEKAKAQWELESRFRAFDAKF
jgi:adenosine deaminase